MPDTFAGSQKEDDGLWRDAEAQRRAAEEEWDTERRRWDEERGKWESVRKQWEEERRKYQEDAEAQMNLYKASPPPDTSVRYQPTPPSEPPAAFTRPKMVAPPQPPEVPVTQSEEAMWEREWNEQQRSAVVTSAGGNPYAGKPEEDTWAAGDPYSCEFEEEVLAIAAAAIEKFEDEWRDGIRTKEAGDRRLLLGRQEAAQRGTVTEEEDILRQRRWQQRKLGVDEMYATHGRLVMRSGDDRSVDVDSKRSALLDEREKIRVEDERLQREIDHLRVRAEEAEKKRDLERAQERAAALEDRRLRQLEEQLSVSGHRLLEEAEKQRKEHSALLQSQQQALLRDLRQETNVRRAASELLLSMMQCESQERSQRNAIEREEWQVWMKTKEHRTDAMSTLVVTHHNYEMEIQRQRREEELFLERLHLQRMEEEEAERVEQEKRQREAREREWRQQELIRTQLAEQKRIFEEEEKRHKAEMDRQKQLQQEAQRRLNRERTVQHRKQTHAAVKVQCLWRRWLAVNRLEHLRRIREEKALQRDAAEEARMYSPNYSAWRIQVAYRQHLHDRVMADDIVWAKEELWRRRGHRMFAILEEEERQRTEAAVDGELYDDDALGMLV